MARLFRDPFTEWLESRGSKPGVYQPGGILGAPPIGWKLTIGDTMIVYRVPKKTPGVLIVAMIERLSDRKGLRSPLAALVRFLSLLRESGTGINEIQGHVEAVSWRTEDSLESARIYAFYQRYLNGRELRVENDVLWIGGELDTVVMPLAVHRNGKPSTDDVTP